MRIVAFLIAATAVACTSSQPLTTTAPAVSPSPAPTARPAGDTSTLVPEATATPAPVRLVDMNVKVSSAPFPIASTYALQAAPPTQETEAIVRAGIERYLDSLNHFRGSGAKDINQLGAIGGRFRDAVAAGMAASATPGVTRQFALGSFRIDRSTVKPWGTRAVFEVTATILDKAQGGTAPDQTETGRLRLVGDRPMVVDGWDDASGRWFNGPQLASANSIREGITGAIAGHLYAERWAPGYNDTFQYSSGGVTAFSRARIGYLSQLDRSTVRVRTFEDVSATIERYDGFAEIQDGVATARINATVVTTDQSGRTARQPFERRVVVLFGNWMPEVVDAQITPGVWLSGGDLALGVRDHNFA